jgi:hypothetical protein
MGLWGQTTVFSEQFNTSRGATYSNANGAIGSDTRWLMSRSGADWGARIDNNILDLSNDASATANADGNCFGYFNNSTHSIFPWNTTLNANPGTVTWEFNMRQIRTDPAGFAAGNYGVAFILAGTSTTPNSTGQGYAVVLGQSGATDPLRLAHYNNGLSGTLTNVITSNTSGLTDFGNQYLSIRVTYKPINDTWELLIRNDGASAFADPTSGTLTSQGKVVNNTYTGTANMNFTGAYWQGSTGANQTAFFDNVYMKVACEPKLNSATKTGLTVRCRDASWKYYGDNTGIFFAIDTTGVTGLTGETVDISIDGTAFSSNSSNGANQEHASFFMKRGWDVTAPAFTGSAKVRFYYESTDSADAVASRNADSIAKKTANPSSHLRNTPFTWFKSKNESYSSWRGSKVVGNKFTAGTYDILSPTYGSQNGVRYVEFSGITSFSGGSGGVGFGPGAGAGASGVGLPVTWAGFDASVQRDYTELIWHTASEQNTSHFEVEASEDGRTFKAISENIAAAGNSASLLSYSFRDMDLAPIKYYRLKQVDIEGTFEYSKIIVAKRTQEANQNFEVKAYPLTSAESKQYQLLLKNTSADISSIQVLDYTGKPVYTENTTSHSEILDLSHLTPGIYMLQVWNGGEKKVERIVVR